LHSYVAEPALNIDALSEQQIEAELKRRSLSSQASFRAVHELLDDAGSDCKGHIVHTRAVKEWNWREV
jgi:hypothetical protein